MKVLDKNELLKVVGGAAGSGGGVVPPQAAKVTHSRTISARP